MPARCATAPGWGSCGAARCVRWSARARPKRSTPRCTTKRWQQACRCGGAGALMPAALPACSSCQCVGRSRQRRLQVAPSSFSLSSPPIDFCLPPLPASSSPWAVVRRLLGPGACPAGLPAAARRRRSARAARHLCQGLPAAAVVLPRPAGPHLQAGLGSRCAACCDGALVGHAAQCGVTSASCLLHPSPAAAQPAAPSCSMGHRQTPSQQQGQGDMMGCT